MQRTFLAGVLQLALITSVSAQQPAPQPAPRPQKTFFTRHDLVVLGAGVAATAAISAFDVRISHFMLQPSQQSSGFHSVVRPFNNVSETTVSWATVAGYLAGRLSHSETLTDIAVHMGEAEVLSTVFGQTVRGVLGRARPSASPDNQYAFHWGKGFTNFPYRAFPSLHSAAGFLLASVVTDEVHLRSPRAARWVGPVLYVAAAGPGLARMYLGQHWASDVFAGAVLGTFLGTRVVNYAHSHNRTKLDRFLIGAAPDGHGGAMLTVQIIR